jgi:hypothetical protein
MSTLSMHDQQVELPPIVCFTPVHRSTVSTWRRPRSVMTKLHHLCGRFGYRPGFLANGLIAGLPVPCAAL